MVWTMSWEVGFFFAESFVAENLRKEFPNELILMNCIWVILSDFNKLLKALVFV